MKRVVANSYFSLINANNYIWHNENRKPKKPMSDLKMFVLMLLRLFVTVVLNAM